MKKRNRMKLRSEVSGIRKHYAKIHVPLLNHQVKVCMDLASLPVSLQKILLSAPVPEMDRDTPGPSHDLAQDPNQGLYPGGVLAGVIQGLDPVHVLGVGDPGADPIALIIGAAAAIVDLLCQIEGVILAIGLKNVPMEWNWMGVEFVWISLLLKEPTHQLLESTWADRPIVHAAETVMTDMTDMMTESIAADLTGVLPLPIIAGVAIVLAQGRVLTLHVATEDLMYSTFNL
ncbi:transformer-2 protein homolog beta isoform X5 [Scyliorhinus canicula]|uniref:transformer-2 protein homolog beta isoform X5 n=1 Tax=Scyliorhinus canicula TaxID=7830 RepID=UPI0018F2BA18|nr:transformer-2 protein homolog beta isoform X5 [Scyliorhinus canicula]